MRSLRSFAPALGLVVTLGALPVRAQQEPPLPDYLSDRGRGVPTSMAGTYLEGGEWALYPFFEYYRDDDFEYKPAELGFAGDQDFRGRYRASEGLLLLAHGLGDDLLVELEAAVISASLEQAPDDLSSLPPRIEESGLGDVEGQIRWRWLRENEHRPELFTYGEVVFPNDRKGAKPLIGTPGWELKLGTGVIRGFGWGTLTARAAIEYTEASSSHFDSGEYALEYLKKLSPSWRVYVGLEGTQDELSLISEAQWRLGRRVMLKLNNGFGLTSKAVDWAPEVGLFVSWGRR